MIYVLYHASLPVDDSPAHANDLIRLPLFINPYTLTAVVDTKDVDHAFELTNSITREWYYNDLVVASRPDRSSMAGDLFARDDGRIFLARNAGWAMLATRLWFTLVEGADPKRLTSYALKASEPSYTGANQ